MFWFEDIYSNTDLVPTPFVEMLVNGKQGVMKKVDDYTVAFEFPEPNYYFPYTLAGSTAIGAGFGIARRSRPSAVATHPVTISSSSCPNTRPKTK